MALFGDPDYRDGKRLWVRALLRLLVVLLIIGLIIWAVIGLYNRNRTDDAAVNPVRSGQEVQGDHGDSNIDNNTPNSTDVAEGQGGANGTIDASNGSVTGSEHTVPESETLPATGG